MKEVYFFEDIFGNFGGIEKMIISIVQNINLEKYKVKLVVNKIISDEYLNILKQHNIKIIELQREYISNPILRHLIGAGKFKEFIKTVKIDGIIHFHISNAIDLVYVFIAKCLNVKNRIVHCHNAGATSSFKVLMHKIFRFFLSNMPTKCLACSKEAAAWLFSAETYEKNEYYIINNAIDVKKYAFDSTLREEIRKKYNWEERFVVGHIGRFNIQKNHRFLIDIFEKIFEKKGEAILVLIGEGELESEVFNYVKERALINNVVFFGVSAEVPLILQAMDIFLLPSLYEGLGIVLIESQAASLPTLASSTVPSEVALTKYIQFLDLDAEPEIWAQKAINLYKLPRDNDVDNLYSAGYDIPDAIKQLENIYDEC